MRNKIFTNGQMITRRTENGDCNEAYAQPERYYNDHENFIVLPTINPSDDIDTENKLCNNEWNEIIAIQGAQKEIEKLSFHKKENLVNYPKIHRRSTEAILNYQKPINNEFELTNIPKFKDLKKQIVYTSRKNKINKIERKVSEEDQYLVSPTICQSEPENFGNA